MSQHRHHQLFTSKLRLSKRKRKKSIPRRLRRLTAFPSQMNAGQEQAIAAESVKVYSSLKQAQARKWLIYGFWAISTIVNIIGLYIWFNLSKKDEPISYEDVISVTIHRPVTPPKRFVPEPIPTPIEESIPTVEETPTPPVETIPEERPPIQEEVVTVPSKMAAEEPLEESPAETEQLVVSEKPTEPDSPANPLELSPLLSQEEPPLTEDTISETIALDTLQQINTKTQNAQPAETDLENLLPLELKPKVVASPAKQVRTSRALPTSRLQMEGDPNTQKQQGIKNAMALSSLMANGKSSGNQKPKMTGRAMDVPNFQTGRRSETLLPKINAPAVELKPLRSGTGEKVEIAKPFDNGETTEALRLQTLPKQKKPMTPKFPPVEGVNTCTVVLQFWVETNGSVSGIRVITVVTEPPVDETTKRAFSLAAIEAAKVAEFNPARRDGQPVRLFVKIPIWFER